LAVRRPALGDCPADAVWLPALNRGHYEDFLDSHLGHWQQALSIASTRAVSDIRDVGAIRGGDDECSLLPPDAPYRRFTEQIRRHRSKEGSRDSARTPPGRQASWFM
jgi:hypothetical protein